MKNLTKRLLTIAPEFRQNFLEDIIQKERHRNFKYGGRTSARKIAAAETLLQQLPAINLAELRLKKIRLILKKL